MLIEALRKSPFEEDVEALIAPWPRKFIGRRNDAPAIVGHRRGAEEIVRERFLDRRFIRQIDAQHQQTIALFVEESCIAKQENEVSGPGGAYADEIAHRVLKANGVRQYSLRRRRSRRRHAQHAVRFSSAVPQQLAQPFEPVGFQGYWLC